MATKKTAKKKASSKAVAKVKSKALSTTDVDAAMAAEIEDIANKIGATETNNIKVKQNKTFTFPDGVEDSGPVDLVVIAFNSKNTFYDAAYNADNPTPPACFAMGDNPRDLIPSKSSPEAQSSACTGCPMNEFGSDGNGKACKNTRSLIVMRADDDPETGQLMAMSVSPTAIRAFDGFVKSVATNFSAPPVKVIVSVGFSEAKSYACLTFGDVQPNPDYKAHYMRKVEAEDMLNVEPDVTGYEKPKKRGRR